MPALNDSLLFQPATLRGLALRNRVLISPMQQYSAVDGCATDWHRLHLARFALGGAALVFTGASAVERRGCNTHGDLGLWDDAHVAPLAAVAAAIRLCGAAAGVQLGHCGRKAGLQRWWEGHGPLNAADAARGEGPWPVVGPSALAVDERHPVPQPLSGAGIHALVEAWGAAAARAARAGFDALEVHAAHGYLIHQFLSPLANRRDDIWGGTLANRLRFAWAVADAVRREWPQERPPSWRLSLADEDDGGLPFDDLVAYVRGLRERGVDVIDASSGGGIAGYPAGRGPVHAELALNAGRDYRTWPRPYRVWLQRRAPLADPVRAAAGMAFQVNGATA